MTKFKRFAALAAVMMLGIQILGLGAANAAPGSNGKSDRGSNTDPSDCDFGNTDLEITIGGDDVAILVDEDGMLQCDKDYSSSFSGVADPLAATAVDSITVEMDHDDSTGYLWILLDDTNHDVAAWPSFGTFDVDITSRLIFDGSDVNAGAANKLKVTVGKDSFSFDGTKGTYVASAIEFADGGDDDTFDASKATVRVYAGGTSAESVGDKAGDDVYKGGSNNDKFDLNYSTGVVIYGNGGNDFINAGSGSDEGWGGDGDDTITLGSGTYDVAAPGAGDDDVTGAEAVSYGDLSGGIKWLGKSTGVATGGAAGDDSINTGYTDVIGSTGDDLIVDYVAAYVAGLAGDDMMKVGVKDDASAGEGAFGGSGNDVIVALDDASEQLNALYGGAGDDILKGKADDDILRGGPGKDQAWGGSGNKDFCAAEITNRCEYGKV